MGVKIYDNQSEETYIGRVLLLRERNGYDDSDFYAICWNDETGKPISIMYDTTRFAGGGGANIDATPEVVEKYKEFCKRRDSLNTEISKLEDSLISSRPGITVRINRGKKHKGEICTVFTYGKNMYGPFVGVKFNDEVDENGKLKNIAFVNSAYVNVIDHDDISKTLEDLYKTDISVK